MLKDKRKVMESGDFFFSGNIVHIHHGQELITMFAHLDRIDVKPGERIDKGQIIGTVGATGRVTGPYLHRSMGLNGNWIDPALFVPSPLIRSTRRQDRQANP